MTMHAFIVATALRDPIAALCERGGDAAALCRRFGVNPALPPHEKLSLRSFVGFSQAAAKELRTPGFGWSVGACFDLANIGPVGQTIQHAPTLGAALRLFRDAFAMVQSDSEIALTVAEDEALLSYRILDPDIWPRDQDAELTIAVLTGLVHRAAGGAWWPCELTFEHGPNGVDGMRTTAHTCEVTYRAATNSLRFPARLLDRALPAGDAASFRPRARSLTHTASRMECDAPITLRVRRQILHRLGCESVGQSSVATALGMSRRTLRRRLEAEGAHFSELLADCRMRVARRLLANQEWTTAEIGELLNYSDATAFERAFRNHEGLTPTQFRQRHRTTSAAAPQGPSRDPKGDGDAQGSDGARG